MTHRKYYVNKHIINRCFKFRPQQLTNQLQLNQVQQMQNVFDPQYQYSMLPSMPVRYRIYLLSNLCIGILLLLVLELFEHRTIFLCVCILYVSWTPRNYMKKWGDPKMLTNKRFLTLNLMRP